MKIVSWVILVTVILGLLAGSSFAGFNVYHAGQGDDGVVSLGEIVAAIAVGLCTLWGGWLVYGFITILFPSIRVSAWENRENP